MLDVVCTNMSFLCIFLSTFTKYPVRVAMTIYPVVYVSICESSSS